MSTFKITKPIESLNAVLEMLDTDTEIRLPTDYLKALFVAVLATHRELESAKYALEREKRDLGKYMAAYTEATAEVPAPYLSNDHMALAEAIKRMRNELSEVRAAMSGV